MADSRSKFETARVGSTLYTLSALSQSFEQVTSPVLPYLGGRAALGGAELSFAAQFGAVSAAANGVYRLVQGAATLYHICAYDVSDGERKPNNYRRGLIIGLLDVALGAGELISGIVELCGGLPGLGFAAVAVKNLIDMLRYAIDNRDDWKKGQYWLAISAKALITLSAGFAAVAVFTSAPVMTPLWSAAAWIGGGAILLHAPLLEPSIYEARLALRREAVVKRKDGQGYGVISGWLAPPVTITANGQPDEKTKRRLRRTPNIASHHPHSDGSVSVVDDQGFADRIYPTLTRQRKCY